MAAKALSRPSARQTDENAQVVQNREADAADDIVSRRVRDFRALKATELHLNDPGGGNRWILISFYRTRDGGTTWARIVEGLPDAGPVNVVRRADTPVTIEGLREGVAKPASYHGEMH